MSAEMQKNGEQWNGEHTMAFNIAFKVGLHVTLAVLGSN